MKKYIIAGCIGPSIDTYILSEEGLTKFLNELFLKHLGPKYMSSTSIIKEANSRYESRFYTQNNNGGKFYWVVKPDKLTTNITIGAV